MRWSVSWSRTRMFSRKTWRKKIFEMDAWYTKGHKIRNEDIPNKVGVTFVVENLRETRLR